MQRSAGVDQSRAGDVSGITVDAARPDITKASPTFPPSAGTPLPSDAAKLGRQGRGDGFGGRGNEERAMLEGRSIRGEDRLVERGHFCWVVSRNL